MSTSRRRCRSLIIIAIPSTIYIMQTDKINNMLTVAQLASMHIILSMARKESTGEPNYPEIIGIILS
jgi:hypothetical protein